MMSDTPSKFQDDVHMWCEKFSREQNVPLSEVVIYVNSIRGRNDYSIFDVYEHFKKPCPDPLADFHEHNARTGITAPHDPVNHPKHYNNHPSGVECITITRHMGFNIGNAIKYLWRADEKGNALQDLEKAAWYIADEIKRRKQNA